MNWTIADWIEAVGGELMSGDADTRIAGVSTDSRTLEAGQLFVALHGPNFDGHNYLEQAVEKGAVAAIVSNPEAAEKVRKSTAVVKVDETLKALGRLATAYRARFDIPVAALSGSSGKTTTKEILRSIVEPAGGLVTRGNFNNRIGVPLTVFRLEPEHTMAVFELAMNHSGELAELTEIVKPETVALTNVGTAHIGNFASIEALRDAKGELIDHSREDAAIVINADCFGSIETVRKFAGDRPVVTFAIEQPAGVRAENIQAIDPIGYRFDMVMPDARETVELHAFGKHNIENALCAATMARLLEIEMDRICEGIESFRPAAMRSEIIQVGKITIIADCYNANPDSVEAAIQALSEYPAQRRRVFLFSDMLEMGDEADMAHRQVGQAVAESRIDLFATTGDLARWASWEAARMGVHVGHFQTKEDAAQALADELKRGDVLLVKGSRLMQLEDVIERLKELL